jgi:hypothetical protein
LYKPLRMSSSWVRVMLFPFGTSGRYSVTGASMFSLPSCASCRITVPVKVLVIEPIRTWSAKVTGTDPVSVREP